MIGLSPLRDVVYLVTEWMMTFRGVDGDPAAFREQSAAQGGIVGGTDELVEALGKLGSLGVSEVQVQHFLFDEDDIPTWLAEEVAPQLASA